MKNQEKTQTKESCNIAAIIMADQYMGFTIPFSKYRDAKVVLPKVFTPAEAETFKKAILPIIAESNDGNIVGDDYEEPCLIVHMFLSARNAKCIGTKRDIMLFVLQTPYHCDSSQIMPCREFNTLDGMI